MSKSVDIFVGFDDANLMTVTIGDKSYTKQLPVAMTHQEALDQLASELKERNWVESLNVIQVGES